MNDPNVIFKELEELRDLAEELNRVFHIEDPEITIVTLDGVTLSFLESFERMNQNLMSYVEEQKMEINDFAKDTEEGLKGEDFNLLSNAALITLKKIGVKVPKKLIVEENEKRMTLEEIDKEAEKKVITKLRKKKEISRIDLIRKLIINEKKREEIIKALQKRYEESEKWAIARMDTYEKKYGEMGKNDEKIKRSE